MKVVIGIVVIIVLGVAYNLFLRSDSSLDSGNEMSPDSMENMQMEAATKEELSDADLKGIHIMGNGDIMLGDGRVLSDAAITADGMVQLSDGRTLEPMADYR